MIAEDEADEKGDGDDDYENSLEGLAGRSLGGGLERGALAEMRGGELVDAKNQYDGEENAERDEKLVHDYIVA